MVGDILQVFFWSDQYSFVVTLQVETDYTPSLVLSTVLPMAWHCSDGSVHRVLDVASAYYASTEVHATKM